MALSPPLRYLSSLHPAPRSRGATPPVCSLGSQLSSPHKPRRRFQLNQPDLDQLSRNHTRTSAPSSRTLRPPSSSNKHHYHHLVVHSSHLSGFRHPPDTI